MIRILIADDHAIVRGGLKQIIATTTDIVVAAEACQGTELLGKLRTCSLDLLLLDLTMPGISGLDLIRHLHSEHTSLPILVLSMLNDVQVVARALRAGAAGYLTKDSDPEVLLAAIRTIASGGRFVDPRLSDAIIFEARASDSPPLEILSDREFEVLRLLAAGKGINDIAEIFSLSAKTISTHKTRLMQKLGLTNNADIIKYSIKNNIISGDIDMP
jgi:DNA-binding NarL/FixJ family response regulator